MKRFDPIPLIQMGGIQPYAQAGGREPGAALMAMLGGGMLGGYNPMDAQRAAQTAGGSNSLLATLASTSPPGGPGSWHITPDQRDRNSEHSKDEHAARGNRAWGRQERRDIRNTRNRNLPYDGPLPNTRRDRA